MILPRFHIHMVDFLLLPWVLNFHFQVIYKLKHHGTLLLSMAGPPEYSVGRSWVLHASGRCTSKFCGRRKEVAMWSLSHMPHYCTYSNLPAAYLVAPGYNIQHQSWVISNHVLWLMDRTVICNEGVWVSVVPSSLYTLVTLLISSSSLVVEVSSRTPRVLEPSWLGTYFLSMVYTCDLKNI